MKAVIYARYSSNKQTEDSIEAQTRACHEYAANKGFSVVQVYADEAISGKGSKTANRVAYQRMLRDGDKGLFDTILIHKYDRISRSLAEHVTLEMKLKAKGITLIAVAQDFGSTNEAKIMRALMWTLSEYYNDNLADETRKGLKETALKGLHTGGVPPFGYDIIDQHYIINELEAGFVRRLFAAAQQRQGYTDILSQMQEAGIKGKRGKPFKYTQVYEILRNEKYTGVYLYSPREAKNRADRRKKENAIRIDGAIPAIISKEIFWEVQKIMNERRQTGHKASYLCSGLVYCSCGAKMHVYKSDKYAYYRCSKKCGLPSVRVEIVDKVAKDYLEELLSPENQLQISDALRAYHKNAGDSALIFFKALQAKVEAKQKEYDNLLQNLSSGVFPPDVAKDIGARLGELKIEIDTMMAMEPPKDYTVETITDWLTSLKAAPDEKAIHLLIERIDIKSKTDINVTSTLTSVLGKHGCGGGI